MKRLIALSLLYVFLSANTAFAEVLRLPTLIHHYIEHLEQDNSTIIKFLAEHYAKIINHPDDEHHDHEKLPFKAIDYQLIQVITIVPWSAFTNSIIVPKTLENKKIVCYQKNYSNIYLSCIWQPPRFS